jgi:signal transduction histidine kinase
MSIPGVLTAGSEFRMEYRLRRYDGEYRWVCDIGVPWLETDGSFAGYIGSCFDITDAKLGAEALSRVSGRLIEAHDQERVQIARELHDDIGASLAVLGIELMRADQPVTGSPGQKHPDLQEISEKLREIGSRVSRLSNQLNPPMLRYFGLAKAIETECRVFKRLPNSDIVLL